METDITWAFESPLQEAQSRLLVQKGEETLSKVMMAKQAGFITVDPVYADKIVKDVVRGINGPSTWRKSAQEEEAEAMQLAVQQKLKSTIAGAAQELGAAGQIAEQVGKGAQALRDGGVLPQLPPPEAQKALPAPNQMAA